MSGRRGEGSDETHYYNGEQQRTLLIIMYYAAPNHSCFYFFSEALYKKAFVSDLVTWQLSIKRISE